MNHDPISHLADILLRGALLLPVCLIFALLLRRGSASLLRRFWRCSLTALLAATALTLAPPLIEIGSVPPIPSLTESTPNPLSALSNDTVPGSPFATLEAVIGLPARPGVDSLSSSLLPLNSGSNNNTAAPFSLGLPVYLALLWLAGVLFLSVRKFVGTLGVIRLRRGAQSVHHPEWNHDLATVRESCGIRQNVALRYHLALRSPIVTGVRKPTIILPADHADYSPIDRRAVLLHELAHVRHRDALFRWVATIARILHWPNPLVWFAERSLRLAEERASDDAVLHGGVAGPSYAELLARLARGGAPLIGDLGAMGQSAMAQPSSLLPRVHALLRSRQSRRQPGRAATLTLATTFLALAILVGGSAFVAADPDPQDQTKEASKAGGTGAAAETQAAAAPGQAGGLEAKLHSIVIPLVDFNDATLDEVLDFLRQKSRELDPEHRGINIISKLPKVAPQPEPVEGVAPPPAALNPHDRQITLRLEQIPVSALLDFICSIKDASYRTSEYAVIIAPRYQEGLESKNLRIPAEVMEGALAELAAYFDAHRPEDPFANVVDPFAEAEDESEAPRLPSVMEWLQKQGVDFPPGASAFYVKAAGILRIRNTPDNLQFIERIIDSLNQIPSRAAMRKADAERLSHLKSALRELIIPVIDFDQANLAEALAFIGMKAKELSPNQELPDPVQFVLDISAATRAKQTVTLKLREVPVGIAIKHILDLAGLRSVITPYGIEVSDSEDRDLHLATFQLSPDKMKRIRESIDEEVPSAPFVLRSVGIEFPVGSGAFWNSKTGDLIVRNDINNLSQIESFLEGLEPSLTK